MIVMEKIHLYRSEPSCDVMCVERVQGDINVTIIILTTLSMASPCTSQQQPPSEPRRHLWRVVASSLLRPTPEPAADLLNCHHNIHTHKH